MRAVTRNFTCTGGSVKTGDQFCVGVHGGSGGAGVLMIMPMTPMVTSALRTPRDVLISCDAMASFEFISSWKHPNQNGIYRSGKLFSFAPLGVRSIKATGTASNVNLGGCRICGKPRARAPSRNALAGSGPKIENTPTMSNESRQI